MKIRLGKSIYAVGLALSASLATAECEFSAAAAARDAVGGFRDGMTGYISSCSIAVSLGYLACGEYWRDENGNHCVPVQTTDENGRTHPQDATEDEIQIFIDAQYAMHPGYVFGDMSTANYGAPYPPPGQLMTMDEWDRFRQWKDNDMNGLNQSVGDN